MYEAIPTNSRHVTNKTYLIPTLATSGLASFQIEARARLVLNALQHRCMPQISHKFVSDNKRRPEHNSHKAETETKAKMNLLNFAATLFFIAPASCRNLRADQVIGNPSTKKGPVSSLPEDLTVINQARRISRRLDGVEDDCIVGNLSGDETATYCDDEGLNCCSGTDSCQWDRKDIKMCANSCTGVFSCHDGPRLLGQEVVMNLGHVSLLQERQLEQIAATVYKLAFMCLVL